jgi:FkbM family methyltransferase
MARGYSALLGIHGALTGIHKSVDDSARALLHIKEALPDFKGTEPVSAAQIAGRDLACKWFTFPESSGGFLVLPATSTDPIVVEYLERTESNAYMLEVLSQTTRTGDRVIDLGCHVGTFSIGAAAMGRKVLSVDASRLHIALIKHSRDINRFFDLQTAHAAISRREGTVRFIENGLWGAIDFEGKSSSTVEVQAKGLDRLLEEHDIGHVKFMKMDIEGGEVDAITTGQKMLTRDQPIIWYESNGSTASISVNSVPALRRLLETMGYRTFRVEGDRWIYQSPDCIQPEMWVDMLALSERDQAKYADRISDEWNPESLVQLCRKWASSLTKTLDATCFRRSIYTATSLRRMGRS